MLLLLLSLMRPALAQAPPSCGDAEACVRSALSYAQSGGELAKLQRAVAEFDTACQIGDPRGACGHARLLRLAWPELGAPSAATAASLSAATAELSKACEGGAACTSLGVAYEQGQGVTADPAQALSLHKRACASGVARSCTRAAELHATGPAEYRDPVAAGALRRQACNAGDAPACEAMAEGLLAAGAPSAGDKAAPLLAKACSAGSTASCVRLARLHLDGALSEPSPEEAARLLGEACAAGDAEACALKP